jgi:hypothetical protein
MKSVSVRLLPVFAAVVLFGQGQARADLVAYSYHWDIQPSAAIASGTGGVQIVLPLDGSTSSAVGVANPLQAATISTFSAATDPADNFNVPFALKLHLTDTASGKAGDLNFAGSLSGQLTMNTSAVTSTFSNPTQTIDLGAHQYAVTLSPAVLTLPAPGASPAAQIKAIVTAGDLAVAPARGLAVFATGGLSVAQAPEPSSLVLGAVAASSLLGYGVRRRRRALARA